MNDDEVRAALKLQGDARLRAKAQAMAKRELTKRHPEEYAQLYAEFKRRLVSEDER